MLFLLSMSTALSLKNARLFLMMDVIFMPQACFCFNYPCVCKNKSCKQGKTTQNYIIYHSWIRCRGPLQLYQMQLASQLEAGNISQWENEAGWLMLTTTTVGQENMTTTYLAVLIRSLLLEGKRKELQREEGGREKRKNYRDRRRKRVDSRILPAWRRHISGLSLRGRQRRLIGAEHGHLEKDGGKQFWMNE